MTSRGSTRVYPVRTAICQLRRVKMRCRHSSRSRRSTSKFEIDEQPMCPDRTVTDRQRLPKLSNSCWMKFCAWWRRELLPSPGPTVSPSRWRQTMQSFVALRQEALRRIPGRASTRIQDSPEPAWFLAALCAATMSNRIRGLMQLHVGASACARYSRFRLPPSKPSSAWWKLSLLSRTASTTATSAA